MQIRKAAATARKALVEMAAQHLGASASELRIENGTIKGRDRSISYAELVGGRNVSLKVDKDAPVKDPDSDTIVGSLCLVSIFQRRRRNVQLHARFPYGRHAAWPRVRPLAIGARLESVEESSVNGVPGLLKVVRRRQFPWRGRDNRMGRHPGCT